MLPCCVCVCVLMQALVSLHVYLQPLVIFFFFFNPSRLLRILSVDECHHLESGVKLSCWPAPAQPSYLLISSGRGQGVRQGRAVARWHRGAQRPTRRQSCGLRCCVISSQPAAEGRRRSHTMVHCSSYEGPIHTQIHTRTHTHTKL